MNRIYRWPLLPGIALLASPLIAQQVPPRARPVDETQPAVPKARPVDDSLETAETRKPAAGNLKEPSLPKETKAPSTPEEDLFNYAYMLYKRESNDLAIEQFGKYIQAYQKGKHLDGALTLKGECHLRLKQIDEALYCYNEVVRRFKTGQFLAYSASRLGTLKFNDNKHAEAAPYFEIAAVNGSKPDDRIQYRYYQGLALKYAQRMNESAAAFEAVSKIPGGSSPNAFQEKALLEVGNHELGLNKKTSAFNRFDKLSREASSSAVKAEAAVSAGLILLDTGKGKEALAYFEPAAKISDQPKWMSLAKFGAIRATYAMENWKKVVDSWKDLDIKEISVESRPQLILMVANAYRVLEQYTRAIDLYNMIEQYFPETKEAGEGNYRKLVCLYKLKDPRTDGAAEEFLDQQKQRDPNSEFIDMARLMRAEDAFAKNKFEPAAKSYAAIRIEKIPNELRASMLYRKGWAEAQSGNHSAAVESLTQYISLVPDDPLVPQALISRAQSYIALKDYTTAIKELDGVVETYPNAKEAEEACWLGGQLRGQNNDPEGMVRQLTVMLDKFPTTKYRGECKFWIGTGLFSLKKYRECLDPLHDAQKLFPEQYEDASIKLMVAHYYLDDTDSLAAEINTYLKTSQKPVIDSSILGYLGQKRYLERNYIEATKFLGLAVNSPNAKDLKPIVWFQLGESQLSVGKNEDCITSLDKFLSLGGELPADRKAKTYYFRGMANLGLKKLDPAKADADLGLALHTQDVNEARLFYLRGEIESARGSEDEAASNYVLTTQLVLNDEIAVEAYRKLIQIYRKQGKSDKEQTFLKLFRQNFPKESAVFEKESPTIAVQPAAQ